MFGNGDGAEQQRIPGGSCRDVPKAQRADEVSCLIQRGEGEAFGWHKATAQLFGRFAKAALSECGVQQALAQHCVSQSFQLEVNHLKAPFLSGRRGQDIVQMT